ncbi:hypothetical protein SARI_00936 [Salmonella enterica subsp. arizonae serovar 62:z4,z23:-]|uniref:Uncharacterized protein n=1 Tax=Salmonella arizonae (strain ATCC BAA-731 / CDC346-86 / RSK2980) TaxID=41514 RepID=A9MMI0_SALAR|nr:hypothetical protein SARI_00936 [Salmonella enterica subsp. arizonae serovar 62:z4,z23:-]
MKLISGTPSAQGRPPDTKVYGDLIKTNFTGKIMLYGSKP